MSDRIAFRPRWREELVGTSERGALVFELTMGTLHVWFPDEARWRAVVPAWARGEWAAWSSACEQWCREQRIPITFTSDAHVSEER